MDSTPVISVQDLSKSYPVAGGRGDLVVVDSVSFELPPGGTVSVVGKSGSGKTTLLGLCAGLDVPSAGTVEIDGARLSDLDEDGRARLRNDKVGFVFQSFQLVPTLTALENVMVPMELRRAPAGEAREAAGALLGRVGLGDRTGHYPAQLSGGEQQRVALARAFINRPKILFADEPTGNLDGETSAQIVDLLFELNTGTGTALVLVTHDDDLAVRTQRILRMRDGRIIDA